MDKRSYKDKAYGILAKMTGAMANAHRLEIVDLLCQGEKSVEQIALATDMSVANTSQHLQVLKNNALVGIRRKKNFIYYKLTNDEIITSWQMLRDMGLKHLAEMEKLMRDFREKRNPVGIINMDELRAKIKTGKVVVLDVRPLSEFENGHVAGAIHVPLNELPSKLKRFAKTKEYIAYCRGPFCGFADEAVQLLVSKGFKARRLTEGYPDWRMKGFPVTSLDAGRIQNE